LKILNKRKKRKKESSIDKRRGWTGKEERNKCWHGAAGLSLCRSSLPGQVCKDRDSRLTLLIFFISQRI